MPHDDYHKYVIKRESLGNVPHFSDLNNPHFAFARGGGTGGNCLRQSMLEYFQWLHCIGNWGEDHSMCKKQRWFVEKMTFDWWLEKYDDKKDLGHYDYQLFSHANLQLAQARDGEAAFELPPGSPDHGRRIAAYYVWVFPNLMLNFYPWGLSVNVVQPLAPGRTRVLFRSFVRDASLLSLGAGGALDPVEMEDEAVVQTVQRGIRSRLYRRGRYSPTHERGVHQFHRLVAAFLAR